MRRELEEAATNRLVREVPLFSEVAAAEPHFAQKISRKVSFGCFSLYFLLSLGNSDASIRRPEGYAMVDLCV